MKVLLSPAHYHLSDKYGSESSWVYNIINNLRKKVDLTVIAGVFDVNKMIRGIKYYEFLKKGRSNNTLIELVNKVRFYNYVYKISNKVYKEFDIIHHVLPFSEASYNLLPILKKIDKPFIMGPALVPQIGDQKFAGVLNVSKRLKTGIINKIFQITSPVFKKLFLKTIKKCDALICPNEKSKEYYSRYISKNKMKVIPPGIDTSRFKPKKYKKDYVEILSAGYLVKRKGNEYLIKALKKVCKKYPDTKLRIAGFGPEELYLKKLTRKLKLNSNITFQGYVPNSKIHEFYQKCDLFCLPTLSDSFPTAILEAMSCGKPVIASTVGGVPGIINKEFGVLVKPKSINELSDSIIRLIKNDKLNEMGKNARERIINKHSWGKIINEYIRLYKEVIK